MNLKLFLTSSLAVGAIVLQACVPSKTPLKKRGHNNPPIKGEEIFKPEETRREISNKELSKEEIEQMLVSRQNQIQAILENDMSVLAEYLFSSKGSSTRAMMCTSYPVKQFSDDASQTGNLAVTIAQNDFNEMFKGVKTSEDLKIVRVSEISEKVKSKLITFLQPTCKTQYNSYQLKSADVVYREQLSEHLAWSDKANLGGEADLIILVRIGKIVSNIYDDGHVRYEFYQIQDSHNKKFLQSFGPFKDLLPSETSVIAIYKRSSTH